MSDELREIIRKYFKRHEIGNWKKTYQDALVKELEEQFLPWHIRERKKWALGLVGEELKEGTLKYRSVTKHEMRGYNQAKAEIRKKVEEG